MNIIKKKEILIDLERLKYINTGLGQVCLNFGLELSKNHSNEFNFTFLVPRKFIGHFGNKVNYVKVTLFRKYFPFLFKKYDLWYSIHQNSSYFPKNKSVPYVLTIHDLNFLKEKSEKKAKKRLKKIENRILRATKIISISEFTKKEVQTHITIKKTKNIQVIYNGIKIQTFKDVEKPKFIPEGDLLFTLGVVQKKKNQKVLIDFIKHIPLNYKLIIAGNDKSKYANELKKEINAKKTSSRIIVTGEISEIEKYCLYKNCKAVLFPSLHEGMGMPPIEAMAFGKPVFASKQSSIPEICEDKAYYWDNFEPKNMSDFFLEKIDEFYSEISNHKILKKHSEKFLWKNNVEQYVKLFKEILL
jgi:glycosyltransferase involved in cell wall biosynthesis